MAKSEPKVAVEADQVVPDQVVPDQVVPEVMVVVMGPAEGRWRIGRHFGRDPVAISAADLTEAQLAALRDDPKLSISIVRRGD